jgi:DNA-directed RNA polymerase subunit F
MEGKYMNVISEQIISDAEAKKILEDRSNISELKHEQKNALSLLKKFVKIDVESAKKMIEELKSVGKLREKQIIEIVNILPQDRDDLRTILQKEYTMFTNEELEKILEIVKSNS